MVMKKTNIFSETNELCEVDRLVLAKVNGLVTM